jgi:hypothetical protein
LFFCHFDLDFQNTSAEMSVYEFEGLEIEAQVTEESLESPRVPTLSSK